MGSIDGTDGGLSARFHISLDLVILIGNPHDSDCLCRKIFHVPYYYILLENIVP